MSKRSSREVPWGVLGDIGTKWKLNSFSQRDAPLWDKYWKDEKKYWGADEPDKRRVRLYFGEENTEEVLLSSSRKKYEEFKRYMRHWNGLCECGEVVQIIGIEKSVIALSKQWMGAVSDHSDLELILKEERTLFGRHVRYFCEIYSFGTRVIPPGSINEQMGERAGTFRVSHRHGLTHDKNETVVRPVADTVIVGDASFQVLP